ncbi:hypothetical protein SeMB42_g05816 [Synchytrium endobioticum]|uniref:Ras-GEF domain-containing protein n=1 Tax=Synchytrium endobioticum TaxID=286115 RepID=A0A507CP74_9FUNG|nr:hypothetical protein SeMB42_g05816 [Synchytrium endobioticum]
MTAPLQRRGSVDSLEPDSPILPIRTPTGHQHHAVPAPAPGGQYYHPGQYAIPPPGARPPYPPHVFGQSCPYPPYVMPMYYPPPSQGFNPADPSAAPHFMPQGYMQGDMYYDPQLQGGVAQPAYGTQAGLPANMFPARFPQNTSEVAYQRHNSLPANQQPPPPPQHRPQHTSSQQAPPEHRQSVSSIQSDTVSVISMAIPPGTPQAPPTPTQRTNSGGNVFGPPPQTRPHSGQHGSQSNRTSTHDDAQGYLPVIPASPLILQQQNIAKALSEAEYTLAKAIDQRQDLSTIRRLTENVNVGKSKLDSATRVIREAQSKLLTDISPRDMAVAITAFDSEMLEFIRPTDLANHASDPTHPPYPIKSSLDFGYYIRRLVQITTVTPAIQTSRVRAIAHWIEVAKELQRMRNFQSYGAVISGLKSQCVQGLQGTWNAVPRKYQQYWIELRYSMSSDESFKAYRNILSTSRAPCIPRLDIFLHALAAPSNLEPCKRELEYYRSKAYASELEGRDSGVQHWIVIQNWKSEEQLNEFSLKQEPQSQIVQKAEKATKNAHGQNVNRSDKPQIGFDSSSYSHLHFRFILNVISSTAAPCAISNIVGPVSTSG